ncbi:MAG: hypothetical protein C5B60_00850 [Chloroflexi bacterium]|nr:MAG: hypothetical protein C5B60_00850 [Chloroflexota bacterium]
MVACVRKRPSSTDAKGAGWHHGSAGAGQPAAYALRLSIEKLFRDAKFTHIYEGTNQIQKIVVANQLLHMRRLWTMISHPT